MSKPEPALKSGLASLLGMSSLAALALLAACATQRQTDSGDVVISVFGINDVHGELVAEHDRGGITGLSGFIDALRAARHEDGGAVLVIDAGDMWQGTLESNLVEGAAVVEAYNAIGITAAAIGNHEFDFGPAGERSIPEDLDEDPRGALKQRAREAGFPLLAANLIDAATGKSVAWDNVRPAVMIDVQGIKIGVIGVISEDALQTTISANVVGLRIAPLADTIRRHAKALRRDGANLVIIAAHAGAHCGNFDDPGDVSSCNMQGEIMRVARDLPEGLVDHIVGGHVHEGIAHVVNDISITSSYSSTRAFGRVDFAVDRETGQRRSRRIFPPHPACIRVLRGSGECAGPDNDANKIVSAVYEEREIVPNADVLAIAERAAQYAEGIREQKLGVYLEAAFDHPATTDSPLANLMTDVLLYAMDVDVAIHNVVGGIRAMLPEGDLTYGSVYEMFPFDNRAVVLDLSGAELRRVIAAQAHHHKRRAGFSGMRVFVSCEQGELDVVMRLTDGRRLNDDDRVSVLANDFLAFGGDGIFTPIIPEGGFAIDNHKPLMRDLLVQWFRSHPGALSPDDFTTHEAPKWNLPETLPADCKLAAAN